MDHTIPDWLREEPDYFITVCANPRGLNQFCHPAIGAIILDSIRYRNERQIWFCHLAVLMPDHIHLIVSFPDLSSFVSVIGNWKHWLAHQHGIRWQENFFDHRIRKGENFEQKAEYVFQNPVRAGLTTEAKKWPYLWRA